jgi:transcriptional regulator with XRE-family HTH domain
MYKKMLGETIYRLRKEKKLSQTELGELVGVSNKAVSKWETYEANPDIVLLPLLAQALGVTADELLSDIISPKDNEGYWEDKKNSILDVVETICKKKPLYRLTMKEVIRKTGLNSGTVYVIFSDIDEVIIALANRMKISVDSVSAVNKILQEKKTPEEKIEALINYSLELILSTISAYGKIAFELSIFAIDTVRLEKISKGIPGLKMHNYAFITLFNVIEENIKNNYFKPSYSKESIFIILSSFIDGFVRDLTLKKCYSVNIPQVSNFEKNDLSKTLTSTILFLLNHEKNEIKDKNKNIKSKGENKPSPNKR